MTVCLLAAWVVVCLAMIRGIQSSGKVSMLDRAPPASANHHSCVWCLPQAPLEMSVDKLQGPCHFRELNNNCLNEKKEHKDCFIVKAKVTHNLSLFHQRNFLKFYVNT